MDRTEEFVSLVGVCTYNNGKKVSEKSSFLLQAEEMLSSFILFEKMVLENVEMYIGYHRFLPSTLLPWNLFSQKEIEEMNQEFTLFLTSFAANINDLRKTIGGKGQIITHRQEMINYFVSRLYDLSRFLQKLRREQIRYADRSFQLSLVNPNSVRSFDFVFPNKNSGSDSDSPNNRNSSSSSNSSKNESSMTSISSKSESAVAPSSWSNSLSSVIDRYESEIATTTKRKEYLRISRACEELKLHEAPNLEHRQRQQEEWCKSMEYSLDSLTSLLQDFLHILQQQSEQVQDLYESSVDVHDRVQDSQQELSKTLERNQSHQWNYFLLAVVLSIFLLLLDYFSS